jgi:hypothetical protein
MSKKFPTYRCKQSFSADLEFSMYRFEKGKTYTDDGTTARRSWMSTPIAATGLNRPSVMPARSQSPILKRDGGASC